MTRPPAPLETGGGGDVDGGADLGSDASAGDEAATSGPVVATGDGSPTLHSQRYDEDYHSRSGAWLEARERYIVPCAIAERVRRGSVRILDVGFGLGWNLAWAVATARTVRSDAALKIVSLEKELLPWSQLGPLYADFPDPTVREWVQQLVEQRYVEEGGISLQLVLGKAEQQIREIPTGFDAAGFDAAGFDAVFLDPFSPPRNPELWRPEFLADVRVRCQRGAILSTYSAATRVKVALLQAGWGIGPGPRVGAKATGTLASPSAAGPLPFDGFSERELGRLRRRSAEERSSGCDPEESTGS